MQIKPLSCCGVLVTIYDFDFNMEKQNKIQNKKVRPWH